MSKPTRRPLRIRYSVKMLKGMNIGSLRKIQPRFLSRSTFRKLVPLFPSPSLKFKRKRVQMNKMMLLWNKSIPIQSQWYLRESSCGFIMMKTFSTKNF